MCSDCPKTQLLSHLAEWGMRSLIIEFKSGFCSVSGMATIISTSNEQLRFRLSAPVRAGCEVGISLSKPPVSFHVTSFAEASESILKPALEEFSRESGAAFQTDIVEEVVDVRFADGTNLLIGLLRRDVAPVLSVSTPVS